MFIVGDKYYGKVDSVPGLFCVKTRFLHIYWVPVVPRASYVFLDQKDTNGSYQGQRIPLRWKSILIAWSRVGLALAIPILAGQTFMFLGPNGHNVHPGLAVVGACASVLILFALYRVTYRWESAELHRALELGQILGLPPEEVKGYFEQQNCERLE